MVIIGAERKIIDKAEINEILSRFKQKLLVEEIPVNSVYLFGSYATSEADRDSDIDVALILPSGVSEDVRKRFDEIMIWAKEIHVKLEIHILSLSDFDNRYLSLPAYVKKYGVVI